MTKTFTENDLVRFLYGEMNDDESAELQEAVLADDSLMRALEDLQATRSTLSKVSFKPSPRTIDKILNYSKGYQKQSV